VPEVEAVEWAMKRDKFGEVVGEVAAAKKWAKKVVAAMEASRDGQRSLLQWITFLTLNELRQVQGVSASSSDPRPCPPMQEFGPTPSPTQPHPTVRDAALMQRC
jgi:hypothetical protein